MAGEEEVSVQSGGKAFNLNLKSMHEIRYELSWLMGFIVYRVSHLLVDMVKNKADIGTPKSRDLKPILQAYWTSCN